MGMIGTFKGYKVFLTSRASYIGNKDYNDTENMFIIGSDVIFKNQIMGYWDGNSIHKLDPHNYTEYYSVVSVNDPIITKKVDTPKDEPIVVNNTEGKSVDDILAGVYTWNIG